MEVLGRVAVVLVMLLLVVGAGVLALVLIRRILFRGVNPADVHPEPPDDPGRAGPLERTQR